MRQWLLLALPALALLSAPAVHAEMFGDDYKPSGDKASTMDIFYCVQAKMKVRDDRLNAAYRDL